MRVHALLLLAIAAVPAAARVTEPPPQALRGYVLGRYAAADDELDRAARYFDLARAKDPEATALTRRAFDLALAAGDKPRTIALADTLAAAGQMDSTVALVRAADALQRKDWAAADAARPSLSDAGYAAIVGPVIAAWTQFGRGKTDAALAGLDPANFSGFARSYVQEQRAHMLAAAGRWGEAATAYSQLLIGASTGMGLLRIAQADAMAQEGDKAGAAKLLGAYPNDPSARAALARLTGGKRIGALAPDPRRGVGWMMARLATDLSRDRPVPLAVTFARIATFLAPDIPAAWLVAGDVVARSGDSDGALACYDKVPDRDPLSGYAMARRAELLERDGKGDAAGKLLLAEAQAPDAGSEDWTRVGDWHRRAERFPDAVAAYSKALTLVPAGQPTWPVLFLRGSARERGGDWPAAEADLRQALAEAPKEPMLLNYLGYSLLDRGQKLDEAEALITEAARLQPGDGGIADSLGWMQYRRGRYAEAVVSLERAQQLEPTDPTVTQHLGDAYWQVGRRIEARFKWRAARDLGPDDKQKAELAARLDYGLDAALAMAR
jgi:tetratricopeptide (TPR) repeat protein